MLRPLLAAAALVVAAAYFVVWPHTHGAHGLSWIVLRLFHGAAWILFAVAIASGGTAWRAAARPAALTGAALYVVFLATLLTRGHA